MNVLSSQMYSEQKTTATPGAVAPPRYVRPREACPTRDTSEHLVLPPHILFFVTPRLPVCPDLVVEEALTSKSLCTETLVGPFPPLAPFSTAGRTSCSLTSPAWKTNGVPRVPTMTRGGRKQKEDRLPREPRKHLTGVSRRYHRHARSRLFSGTYGRGTLRPNPALAKALQPNKRGAIVAPAAWWKLQVWWLTVCQHGGELVEI